MYIPAADKPPSQPPSHLTTHFLKHRHMYIPQAKYSPKYAYIEEQTTSALTIIANVSSSVCRWKALGSLNVVIQDPYEY